MTLADLENEYPVELIGPDLSAYRKGTNGVDYVHTLRATAPGPHVAVTAIVHGNEPCGAIVLDRLLKADVRPLRGSLSFAFVNVAAYEAFDPAKPNLTRWIDEDFNRLWSPERLDEPRTSVELERARELRPFIDTVDLLLDIHSMQHVTEPLMMAGPHEKGVSLAKSIGVPATIVVDAGHIAGPRLRDYPPFVGPQPGRNAVLVECGQHWERASAIVALDTTVRFLRATGAVGDDVEPGIGQPAPPQRVLDITDRVTVKSKTFTFSQPFRGFEVIAKAGTVIAMDGDREVRTPYDNCVLIMPSKRLWLGQTAVRLGRFRA